jgi:hypothetical protein
VTHFGITAACVLEKRTSEGAFIYNSSAEISSILPRENGTMFTNPEPLSNSWEIPDLEQNVSGAYQAEV